jgi:Domain of unknown function (DUF222)/HNH endonuclease
VAVVETENVSSSDLSDEELEDEIATLASHIYAGTCRWLELVGELDRRGGFAGCTVAEWLAWRCALTPRAAREHVRVARRLSDLPLIHDAFARGELSYAKVRALTRVADERTEEELLEFARHLTASQLERAVRVYRSVTAQQANDLQALAYVGYSWAEDGSLILRARLAPEDGALLLRALEAARDRLQDRAWSDERGSAEPHTPRRATNAEALVAMADMALSEDRHGRTGGERYQVVVHVEAQGGASALEDGPALSEETARRLACDASLVEFVGQDGEPLSVGRRTRTVPSPMRRALQNRDRTCQFPGCDNRRFLDAHHIEHWSQGGETKLDNLILLCRRHHTFVHEGGYSLELTDGDVGFRDRWGTAIEPVPRPPPGDLDRLLKGNDFLEIDERTCAGGDGDRMDMDLTLAGLIRLAR